MFCYITREGILQTTEQHVHHNAKYRGKMFSQQSKQNNENKLQC